MMHLYQQQVHQALQGRDIGLLLQDILPDRSQKLFNALSLQNQQQGLTQRFIQLCSLLIKQTAFPLQQVKGLGGLLSAPFLGENH